MSNDPNPPRWAEALLRLLVRPSDRDSISGDLLEEYRAAKRPALGALRANAWYLRHVFSLLWRLIRPFALALAGVSALSLMVQPLWYGSLVPAPGVSLIDALIYFWSGYRGSERTHLIRTGMVAAGGTSLVGFAVFFGTAAIRTPGLVLAPFRNPFIFVILSVYLLLPLGYGILLGAVGGAIGRWFAPAGPQVQVS